MRYSGYGAGEVRDRTESRQRARPTSKGPGTDKNFSLPPGVAENEAVFLLGVFARLKEVRFGRVEVTVEEAKVTGVEFVEKVERNLIQSFSS